MEDYKLKLKKLDDANAKKIENQCIICYEKSVSYLKEFKLKNPELLNNIVIIVDDYKRNQGEFVFEDKHLAVSGSEIFETIELKNSAILIMSDYFKEAYDKLCEQKTIQENTEVIYYFANQETEYEEEYRALYKESELENIIVFRSGPHASAYVKGMDFADNARALFEYMLENSYNEKYELIWLVKNPEEFEAYRKIKNVHFLSFNWSMSKVKEERDSYYRALCLAKYIFFTDAYGFSRNTRSGQVRVQLWHGCGFKTRVNFVRCEKRYEYTTVISDLYSKIHQQIYGLREDQVLVTGYAKQDWLFQSTKEYWNKLSIPEAKKYIFWLPTFRMAKDGLSNLNEYDLNRQTGLPIINTYEQLEELNILLQEKNTVLVLKLHPFQDRSKICRVDMTNIFLLENEVLVEKDIQINQLLGETDALISDYSSVAVDYMLLDKPIAFTLDDVEEYKNSRGFVFDNIRDWLPGKEIFDFEDFCDYVKEIAEGEDSTRNKRHNIAAKMLKFRDNQNCKRIVEALNI